MAQLDEALRYKPEDRGSISNGVTGIFHLHNPSSRTMALRSTQPLTEMNTRSISYDYLEIWEPQPPGTLWACPGP